MRSDISFSIAHPPTSSHIPNLRNEDFDPEYIKEKKEIIKDACYFHFYSREIESKTRLPAQCSL